MLFAAMTGACPFLLLDAVPLRFAILAPLECQELYPLGIVHEDVGALGTTLARSLFVATARAASATAAAAITTLPLGFSVFN